MSATPVMIEKFTAGRALVKGNPTAFDDSIAKLSAEAQVPAKKFLDLLLSNEEDPAKIYAAIASTKAGLSESVNKEIEANKDKNDVAKILSFFAGP